RRDRRARVRGARPRGARRARARPLRARGIRGAGRGAADVSAAERRRDRLGPEERVMATARKAIEPLEVHVLPMRRRHLRSLLRIEAQVYPRPWSHSLFVSELALRSTRAYFVAKVGRDVVGYGGLMMSLSDGHVTTIAVDPQWQRSGIGLRLL